jgi:hypothetical protein
MGNLSSTSFGVPVRVIPVEPGRVQQAHDGRSPLARTEAADEQPVLSAQRDIGALISSHAIERGAGAHEQSLWRGGEMKEPIRNPGLRISPTVVLALVGFVFPLAFAAAALIGWSLYQDFKNPRDIVDDWTTRRWTTTEADPEWRTYFHKFCDSPAETAFMDAMIASHDLKPSKGVLVGNGIELNLQVKMKPYRADFIVNKL